MEKATHSQVKESTSLQLSKQLQEISSVTSEVHMVCWCMFQSNKATHSSMSNLEWKLSIYDHSLSECVGGCVCVCVGVCVCVCAYVCGGGVSGWY